jgi:hypothetical protein
MMRWLRTLCDRVQQWAVVRVPVKVATSVKRIPLAQPAPLVISLEELAPVWLRHNQDFRPANGEGLRPIGVPAISMEEALAPMRMPATTDVAEPIVEAGRTTPVSASAAPPRVVVPAPVAMTKRVSSSAFMRDFVVPYQGILEMQKVLKPILTMIDVLEEYGQCPSVVLEAKTQDEEAGDLYSIRDTLAQVTLRDHTHRVTKHGLEALVAYYKDPEPLIPKMLMACLGHDLGKIPAFRSSGIYSMRDHPNISVMKIREYCQKTEIFWIDEVCDAIQAHHRHVKDSFASLLKVADGRAREEEVAFVTKTLEIKNWASWFDPQEFLALLEPLINMGGMEPLKKGEWVAVSLQGVIYCQTRPLYGLLKELARQKKIVDIHLLRLSDRDHVLCELAASLGKAGLLSEPIGEGFSGRRYKLRLKTKKEVPIYAVPILESAVTVAPSALEQRKTGFFNLIEDVVR